ncbi:CDP-glucose 4,6-dehydratase [Virgibacillus sp. JSM 102003]|uniref:CDP-glucose 4,6-dehydratase n=1 Tax=Virgibacillus sp. JSM 102003 TaxID=1562108 RepID=UPI0035C22743
MIERDFWKGRKVFITGHTGFKGSWLCMWLHSLGADVTGFSLAPPTNPNLFDLCNIQECTKTVFGDVRNHDALISALLDADPEIVIHMAAQPIVRASYQNPVETYETNVMGTVYLLEAVKKAVERKKNIKAVINVTSDKCYENMEWIWGYRETDPMGGYDPYSNSKACSELVTSSYRSSFFDPGSYKAHGVALASARAGNVIGGGDFSADRLIPDCIKALLTNEEINIRNPHAIRPWQHVLDPLSGYLLLAQKLFQNGGAYAEGWNFGPVDEDARRVEWIVEKICEKWGSNASYKIENRHPEHEASFLKLDCSKSKQELGWSPRWNLDHAIDKTLEWTKAYMNQQDLKDICLQQIEEYSNTKEGCN